MAQARDEFERTCRELRAQHRQLCEGVGLETQELHARIEELQAEYLRRKGGENGMARGLAERGAWVGSVVEASGPGGAGVPLCFVCHRSVGGGHLGELVDCQGQCGEQAHRACCATECWIRCRMCELENGLRDGELRVTAGVEACSPEMAGSGSTPFRALEGQSEPSSVGRSADGFVGRFVEAVGCCSGGEC